MLDMIGAIFATAVYGAIVAVLVGIPRAQPRTKLLAFAAAAAWGGAVTTAAALGGLAPGVLGPVPATLLPFAVLLAVLIGAWYLRPRFRSALLSIPLPALIGLNAARLGGVFFLILAADNRLSAPFAPVAGLGDMLVASLAIPLAVMSVRKANEHASWLRLWNALGALDLVVAISLGILSAPGTPLRVFSDGPGTLAMTTLPWAFVPGIIVPLFLVIHLTIATRLAPRDAVGSDQTSLTHCRTPSMRVPRVVDDNGSVAVPITLQTILPAVQQRSRSQRDERSRPSDLHRARAR